MAVIQNTPKASAFERLGDAVRDLFDTRKSSETVPTDTRTVEVSKSVQDDLGLTTQYVARTHERPVYYDAV